MVNEQAGNGRGRRVYQRIRALLRNGDDVGITQGVGDGRRIAAEAVRVGHRLVVALGGDGTVNETVNGLADAGFKAALGVIPAGGGNDAAHALGIPPRPEEAVALLRNGSPRPVDLALVSWDGGERQRYYLNILGMGVSGEIAALSQGRKRLGGGFTYLALLLRRMLTASPVRLELDAEGEPLCREALAAHMANGRREGHFFSVAPTARVDDGLLDLVAVRDVPLLSRPWYAWQVMRGRLLEQAGVCHRRVRSASVRALDPLPCHMDGEPFVLRAGQEARVEVQEGVLQVVAPGGPTSP